MRGRGRVVSSDPDPVPSSSNHERDQANILESSASRKHVSMLTLSVSSGGLQDASSTVGNVITEQTQSSGQKKADAANKSLTEMAGGMLLMSKRAWDSRGLLTL